MLLCIRNKYVFELFVIKHFDELIIHQQANYQVLRQHVQLPKLPAKLRKTYLNCSHWKGRIGT